MAAATIRSSIHGFEPIMAQGRIKRVFPQPHVSCTQRAWFAQHEMANPADDMFAMKRGIFTGGLGEHDLHHYGSERGFSVDLGRAPDGVLSTMNLGPLGGDRVQELRAWG